jgi:hypothetical protein
MKNKARTKERKVENGNYSKWFDWYLCLFWAKVVTNINVLINISTSFIQRPENKHKGNRSW